MPLLTSTETYQFSEFPNHSVNAPVLAAQIAAAALSVPLIGQPQLTGSSAVLNFTGTLSAADVTALNAIVAAHTGAAFGATITQASDTTDSTNATTTFATKLTLTAGPLPAGVYLGAWACEHYLDVLVANQGTDTQLLYNGSVLYEDTWNQAFPHLFGGALPFTVIDGAQVVLTLQFKLLSAAALAHCRRARLAISMQ